MKNERRLIRSDVSSLIQNGVQSDEAHKKRTASSCMSTEMKDFPPGREGWDCQSLVTVFYGIEFQSNFNLR